VTPAVAPPEPTAPWYRRQWAWAAAAALVVLVPIAAADGRAMTNTIAVCARTLAPPTPARAAPAASPRTVQTSAKSRFPASVSSNRRYLIDQSGDPYLIVGDSAWSMSSNVSASDMDYYFANRQAQGFNTALVGLLVDAYIGGRDDLSTYDGLYPFTAGTGGSSDLSSPNPIYWSRMDTMVRLAQEHGITLMLAPADTGGLLPLLRRNGAMKDFNYGAFLGDRYKNDPNIIWISGNDYLTSNWGNDPYVTAVAKGIRSADPNHFQTIELGYYSSTSVDNPNWPPLVNLNAAYTYYPAYDEVLKAYNGTTQDPVFMVEASYEDSSVGIGEFGTPPVLRRQEYWTMLSGATGQLYGNDYIWRFKSGWKNHLDTTGTKELGHMKSLFSSVAWYRLVPDQIHGVLSAGYGTCTSMGYVSDSNYATAAITDDGSLGIVYMPTIRTITIELSKFSGSVTARWYDPTTGIFTTVSGSPFANTGIHLFKPTGNNSGGSGDWVLALHAV
jgi:hypothetical protein